MDSLLASAGGVEPIECLHRFRQDLYSCLLARGDELFELTDARCAPTGRSRRWWG